MAEARERKYWYTRGMVSKGKMPQYQQEGNGWKTKENPGKLAFPR
jgi:hypothetical protein